MVLAHFAQRRHVSPDDSPSSTSQELLHDPLVTLNSDIYLSSSIPPPLEFSYLNLSSTADDDDVYFGSNQSSPFEQATFPSSVSEIQLMTGSPSQNPRLRVQQSTPSAADLLYSPPPMSGGSYQGWNNIQDWSHLSAQQQQYNQPVYPTHKRVSSESSVGSAGPASPYTLPSTFPHIVDTDTQSVNSPHFDGLDHAYSTTAPFVKPLPANASSLHNGTLFHQAYSLQPNVNNAGQYIAQQSSVKPVMGGQRVHDRSGRRTASTEQSFGAGFEVPADVRTTPNLERTTSDAYQDELYNPAMQQATRPSPQPSQAQQNQVNLLSPYRQTFTERLQAANAARTASPTTNMARERSPFRESSEYASAQEFAQNPDFSGRINSAQRIREAQKMQSDAQVYRDHNPQTTSHDFASPTTISPQEVSLDYHESEDESKNFPLFPQPNPQVKDQRGLTITTPRNRNPIEQSYNTGRSGPSPYPTSSSVQQTNPQLTFMPPSAPGTHVPQTYPFISHPRRSQNASDHPPEFPATLSSMESTKSDSGSGEIIRPTGFGSQPASQEASSQEAKSSSSPLTRPTDTSANGGSYICVVGNCVARFDSSSKLQKHRRETHPTGMINTSTTRVSVSPYNASASPATPSSATNSQAAANNISRNNQPGPHKCERINPSTGKPCNTVFSRSYDLTRHEDTIHSNRKHKVRCHLCVEEKTFSRNDALTRHMRVVHPEVDMGGKGKRGGRS